MILKLLLPLLITVGLFAESKVQTQIEAGLFVPTLTGSINNTFGTSNFADDFAYSESTASYFKAEFLLDYEYAPNFYISYFNMQENSNATLDRNVTVVDKEYGSRVRTVIDYSVLESVIYKDFKQKGTQVSVFGDRYYTGDFEFDVGVNIKLLMWNFEVTDLTDLSSAPSWINARELIPLPYLGFKYHMYRLTIFSEVSALSIVEAKAMSYQVGTSFRVISGLSLSASYMHESFEVLEKDDIVDFGATGYKLSFIYAF